jgi:membrane protein required for colicin V production
MEMNAIDIVFTLIVVFMIIRSGFRGFVREFMAVASLGAGLAVSVFFSGRLALLLDDQLGVSPWNSIIAFLVLFLLVYLIVKLTERGLNAMVEQIQLDSFDHALGLFFGSAEGLVLVFTIILLMSIQPFVDLSGFLAGSVYAEVLSPLTPYVDSILGG